MAVEVRTERELKLDVVADFQLPDLGGVVEQGSVTPLDRRSYETTYYDTSDLRLARAGISLRCRVGEMSPAEGLGCWTLKLPGKSRTETVRHELVVNGLPTTPPEEFRALVHAFTRRAPLASVAALRAERTRYEVRAAGHSLAEIDDDDVAVVNGPKAGSRFRELEVEFTGELNESVEGIVAALRAAGAADASAPSKLVRALGDETIGPPEVVVPKVYKGATLGQVAQAAIASGLLRLLRHDPWVRVGTDPDDVHQARVATRRLRSHLRALDIVLDPAAVSNLRDELRWVGAALGGVRDADVLLDRLGRHGADLGRDDERGLRTLVHRLEAEREKARADLLQLLDSERYLDLLEALVAAAGQPPLLAKSDTTARPHLQSVIDRDWKKLRRAVDALGRDPEDAALHDVRIRAKRLRYSAEASGAVLGRNTRQLAKAAASLQDVLGRLQDAAIASEWLRRARVKTPPTAAFVAGELVAREHVEREAARAAWSRAWKKLRNLRQ